MKQLYFCRHGESLVNIRDIFATRAGTENDLGLTEAGKSGAIVAGQRAAAEHFAPDLILSSPLLRARETAIIIAEQIGYPKDRIETQDMLIEIQYGELEGTTWNKFWNDGNTYANLGDFAGAETIEALQQRAQTALDYLRGRPEETILVVSHSAFGRALKRAVAGLPYTDEFVNGTSLPHAKIVQLV
jgi:broad specificity phosphatase PhoE